MQSYRVRGGPIALAAFAVFTCSSAKGAEPELAPPPPARVEALAWLAGCWAPDGGEPGSVEQWTAPAGGTMLGLSRTIRNGTTRGHEFLEIRETTDGDLVYIAHPSGQATTPFRLLKLEERSVVFENSAHDYPQRIRYRLEGEDRLLAGIEGEVDGKIEAREFPMHRVACDR